MSTGLAQLQLDAVRDGGSWRISAVKVNPADKPAAPIPGGPGPGTDRDTAVTAARSLVADLLYADSADTEGTYARWLGASAEPMLSSFRAMRGGAHDPLKGAAVKASVVPDPVCAVTGVDADKASVLVAASVNTTNAGQPPPTPRAMSLRLALTRVSGAWKASNVEIITATA